MNSKQKLLPYIHTDGNKWEHYFYDVRSNVIYYEAKYNGKRIKFSTREKVPNGVKAKRFANAEIERRMGFKKVHVRTLISEELKSWELLKETEGLKYDTMNNIRRARKQIEPYWGNKLPSEISRDSFAEWCTWWRKTNTEIEMENAIKYFNNFCRYLHEKVVHGRPLLASSLRFQDPNRKVIAAKRNLKKERIFTHDEFKKVKATAKNEVEALIVHFMYTMATRIDETLNLDFDGRIMLDHEPPMFRWSSGTNKAELVGQHALHVSLVEPLEDLRRRRKMEGTKLLFPQKMDPTKPMREQLIDWAAWRDRADLGWHWTSHTFRHTALTNLFNNPANPQLVICKLYRISLEVALKTYVKVLKETMLGMRDPLGVKL